MSAGPRTSRTVPAGWRRLPARPALALVTAFSLAGLGACSSGEEAGSTGTTADASPSTSAGPSSGASPATGGGTAASTTVTATATDFAIALDTDQLSAGEYTFEVVNDGSASHDLVVEQDGEDVAASDVIPPGETTSVTVTLEPGEYVFYCSVGNHREMGMELTVQVT